MTLQNTVNWMKLAGRSATALAILAGSTQITRALPVIPYPNVGTPNPTTYVFTAAASGDVVAYFAGSGASYDEQLGMLDNGVETSAGLGLDDHTSTLGQSFDLGTVKAGDTLTFFIDVLSPNLGDVYSNPALNTGYDTDGSLGHNHVYSVPYSGGSLGAGIPNGTYVGFEDLQFPNSDFNYFDETYVFTDVATVSNVPDAASSIGLLTIALAGMGLVRRRFCA
jgi:hypothetical protein